MTHDVFQSMPFIKKRVQFSDYPSISNYETDGELWPYTASSRRFAHEFPVDYVPKFDERAVSDATLIGTMHEAMMKDLLKGTKTPCKFQCDSDFGCDSCIPAGLTAEPEIPILESPRVLLHMDLLMEQVHLLLVRFHRVGAPTSHKCQSVVRGTSVAATPPGGLRQVGGVLDERRVEEEPQHERQHPDHLRGFPHRGGGHLPGPKWLEHRDMRPLPIGCGPGPSRCPSSASPALPP